MEKDDNGFTLIELIVVIAIMGILIAVVALSASVATSARAKSCAVQLNDSLARCRVNCLAQAGTSYLKISQNENNAYVFTCYGKGTSYTDGTELTNSTISCSGITLSYPGDSASTITRTDPLTVSFNRDGTLTCAATSGDLIFTVTGGGHTYTITVVGTTGSITCS